MISPSAVFSAVGTLNLSVPIGLLVLDATLADDLSDRIARQIRLISPTCKIVLLIPEPALSRMVELARLGSDAYVFEEAPLTEVRDAIDRVLQGRPFCSQELANALLAQLGKSRLDQSLLQYVGDVQLTSREREVLELIAWEQLSNKQIARRLSVSVYTVKNHVHKIIEKLGVEDRHSAAQFAHRRKLLVGQLIESNPADSSESAATSWVMSATRRKG